eukprot:CAMPEP_0201557890 /NCGR_PEP_ID=MMETSP0173_2-20130828/64485_1 /ASSEMBLY_ACC=CAM_ASM_000268 /TAXON_ID=218659 /ORGANISM="Vexillifera sp., Strain DIVA3 564/2" /LENGTH=33 /DNA_ID= /DNA_START= /DNA_END= /DNA_ORIENTATION=
MVNAGVQTNISYTYKDNHQFNKLVSFDEQQHVP